VKALCWEGTNNVKVEEVPEPRIRNSEDVILKVRADSGSMTWASGTVHPH